MKNLTLATFLIAATASTAQALPYCYMQNPAGEIINLESMCAVTSSPVPVAAPPSAPTAESAPEAAAPTANLFSASKSRVVNS